MKGSEDMLLIPESDAGSIPDSDFDPRECEVEVDEFYVPASSPPPAAGADDGEDMLEGATPTASPKLDLRRFAFKA